MEGGGRREGGKEDRQTPTTRHHSPEDERAREGAWEAVAGRRAGGKSPCWGCSLPPPPARATTSCSGPYIRPSACAQRRTTPHSELGVWGTGGWGWGFQPAWNRTRRFGPRTGWCLVLSLLHEVDFSVYIKPMAVMFAVHRMSTFLLYCHFLISKVRDSPAK